MFSLFLRARDALRLYLPESGSEASAAPTLFRVRIFACGIAISHVLFGFLMSNVEPQPFENMAVRAALASLALVLVWQSYSPWLSRRIPGLTLARSFVWSIWLHLFIFSFWMYFMNGCNALWLAYVCTSIMMGFLLMKWRQALNGLSLALMLAPALVYAMGQPLHWPPIAHICMLTLASSLSLIYAVFMGHARGQHLRQSLAITGLMQARIRPSLQHLRRELDRLNALAQQAQPAASASRLQALALVFEQSLGSIEHQLQVQRNNAQMLGLGAQDEDLNAQSLLQETLLHYPFRSPSQRRCLQIEVEQNFVFKGNRKQWQQALNNLLQNALDSLHHTKLHLRPGDLRCYVRMRGNWGRISVQDFGLPIKQQTLAHVFEPFYSEGPTAGLGLGLSFCQQLAQHAGGRISIASDALNGTVVHLYFPRVAACASSEIDPKQLFGTSWQSGLSSLSSRLNSRLSSRMNSHFNSQHSSSMPHSQPNNMSMGGSA